MSEITVTTGRTDAGYIYTTSNRNVITQPFQSTFIASGRLDADSVTAKQINLCGPAGKCRTLRYEDEVAAPPAFHFGGGTLVLAAIFCVGLWLRWEARGFRAPRL